MCVLDASLLIEILVGTPLGIRQADRVLNSDDSLHAPHLLDVEVLLTSDGRLARAHGHHARIELLA